ncbi:MAG TPA: enoyl-CoA hydratase/isomerase family protein [Aestuariivirgaceae bacterium]|nr:enoyl-CoA hydratase/isomerase family protein [Aestuariivirgaceae bacterium]
MADPLLIERDGVVTTLVLNRPEKRNALSAELVDAMIAAIGIARDDGTRLLVVRGAGAGFSGGFDFGKLDEHSDGDLALRFIRLELLLQGLWHAPFATMALAHGACYGAAADIVASCHRRIAAPGTKFRMPGLAFGVSLGTRRLAAVIGADAARRLLETSAVFDADEALAFRFLTGIRSQDDWPEAISEAANTAEALPQEAQRLLLRQTVEDFRSQDLAVLIRSVAEPGLKQRIEAFLASGKRRVD